MKKAKILILGCSMLSAMSGTLADSARSYDKVKICDDTGCSIRDSQASAPAANTTEIVLQDEDVWKGESVGELKSQADQGKSAAVYKLGQAYAGGLGGAPRDLKRAVSYFEQAADQGHPWAQFRLAQIYKNGVRGIPAQFLKAVRYIFAAAKQGIPAAEYNVAVLYGTGNGAPKDQNESVQWLKKAADHHMPQAQYALGMLYLRGGKGVEQQLYDGSTLLTSAASQGYNAAQLAVGRIYLTGLDTMGQDLSQARHWLSSAAQGGNKEAAELLKKVEQLEEKKRDFENELRLRRADTLNFISGFYFNTWYWPPIAYGGGTFY